MNRGRQVNYKREESYIQERYHTDHAPKSGMPQHSKHVYTSEDSRAASPVFEHGGRPTAGTSVYRSNVKHPPQSQGIYANPIQTKEKHRDAGRQEWNDYASDNENDCHVYRKIPEYYDNQIHHQSSERIRHGDMPSNTVPPITTSQRSANQIDHLSPLPRADIDGFYDDTDWDKNRPVNLDQLLQSPSMKAEKPKIRLKNSKACMEAMVSDLKEMIEAELGMENERRQECNSPRMNRDNLQGYNEERKQGGMTFTEDLPRIVTRTEDNQEHGSLNLKVNLTGQEVLLVVNPTQQATLSIPVKVSISHTETQENDKASLFADSLINFLFQDCTLESDVRNRIKTRIDEYMNMGGLRVNSC